MFEVENKIEQDACAEVLKYLGIKSIKFGTKSQAGYPDRLFWLPGGRPLLIEFKKPGEEPEPIQLHIHAELLKLGYLVEVHDNVADAFEAVINAVDTPRLLKASREVLAGARRRCAVLRSRPG